MAEDELEPEDDGGEVYGTPDASQEMADPPSSLTRAQGEVGEKWIELNCALFETLGSDPSSLARQSHMPLCLALSYHDSVRRCCLFVKQA